MSGVAECPSGAPALGPALWWRRDPPDTNTRIDSRRFVSGGSRLHHAARSAAPDGHLRVPPCLRVDLSRALRPLRLRPLRNLRLSEPEPDVSLYRSRRLIARDGAEARLIRPHAVRQQVAVGVERKIQRVNALAGLKACCPTCATHWAIWRVAIAPRRRWERSNTARTIRSPLAVPTRSASGRLAGPAPTSSRPARWFVP